MAKQERKNNDDKRKKSFRRTVTLSKIPIQLHLPFIQRGYRLTDQPWSYYFKSLFQLHNETINIWTQCIGLLLIAIQTVYYFLFYRSRDAQIQWTALGLGTCCCIALFNSAIAHLLYSKSPSVNFLAFKFDYLGAVIWGYGTVFLSYYGLSDKYMHDLIGPYFSKVHTILSYLNFLNACYNKIHFGNNPRMYLVSFGLILESSVGFTPSAYRYVTCFRDPECSFSSLNHISIILFFLILMTFTFLLHIPERYFPGRFDIIGQSHQIFHVLVIFIQWLEFRSLYVDFESGANSHCAPDIFDTFLCLNCFVCNKFNNNYPTNIMC